MIKEKCSFCGEVHTIHTWCVVDKDGRFQSYDGRPARSMLMGDGEIELWWCKEGKVHRVDGPAIIRRVKDFPSHHYRLDGAAAEIIKFFVPFETIDRIKKGEAWHKFNNHYVLISEAEVHEKNSKMFLALENSNERVFVLFQPDLEHAW